MRNVGLGRWVVGPERGKARWFAIAHILETLKEVDSVEREKLTDEIIAQTFAENEMSVFLAREGLAEIAYAYRQGVQDPDGVPGLTAPDEISVVPSPELIGFLTVRRVHYWYSEAGLPEVRSYLRILIEQIDSELTPKESNQ